MGYCVFMLRSDFFIPHEAHMDVLEVIQRLDPSQYSPDSKNSHFAFFDGSLYKEAKTLGEVLKAWRWLPEFDTEEHTEDYEVGNIIGVEFLGEKLGDDGILFEAIAPFVREGSSIQMAGEDGRIWRWFFCNGTVQEQKGEIIYS